MDLFKLLKDDKPYFTNLQIVPFTAEMEQEVNMFTYSRIWHSSTSVRVADIVVSIFILIMQIRHGYSSYRMGYECILICHY